MTQPSTSATATTAGTASEHNSISSAIFKLTKLNGTNYSSWSCRMEHLLEEIDALDVITSSAPDPITDGWKMKERKALRYMVMNVDDNQLDMIRNCSLGSEAWKILKSYYQRDSAGARDRIRHKLYKAQMESNSSMRAHLDKLTGWFHDLEAIKDGISERDKISIIFSSLNSEYENLVTALEAWDDKKLTLNIVKGKLIDEWERRQEIRSKQPVPMDVEENTAKASSKYHEKDESEPKINFYCHQCGKPGHFRYQCKYNKRNMVDLRDKLNKMSDEKMARSGKMYITSFNQNNSDWLIDSGASMHMCNREEYYDGKIQPYQSKIITASGEIIAAKGIGNVKCTFNTKNGPFCVTFEDVLYVPSLEENLISVKKIVSHGMEVKFNKNGCFVKYNDSNEQICIGKCFSELWKLNTIEKCFRSNVKTEYCIHDWHKKLAHRNLEDIKLMNGNGITIKSCNHSDVCEACIKGKMFRKTFPKKAKPTSEVMECVVSDVCGPIQCESIGKKKYFVSFIDIHSRHCTLYFIREKSEVPQVAMNYIEYMKTQLGKKPKILRTDRGTEYNNKTLQNYLRNQGIKYQCTVGYAPEQNGVAERKNRTIMEAVRTMLEESQLGKCLWAEAADAANHVFNRIVDKRLGMSPHEKLFNQKPRKEEFHQFGTDAYIMIPYEKRRKLDVKAHKVKFIGYDDHSKGYRFIDHNYKIYVEREVTFLDSMTPFAVNNYREKECESYQVILTHHNAEIIDDEEFFDAFDEEITLNNEEDPVIENEEPVQDEEEDDTEEVHQNVEIQEVRRSTRNNIGKAPEHLKDYHLFKACESESFEPKTYKQATTCKDSHKWFRAMCEELNSIEENNTWECVKLPKGKNAVGSKWVYKLKKANDGSLIYKARLVAQGYSQIHGEDYGEVFAPVARSSTMRILLSIAGSRKYNVKHYDIKTAFLNGKIEEEIYLKPAPGFEIGQNVYKLHKSLYGLKQAAHVWNKTLHNELVKVGFIQNYTDKCLYTAKKGSNVCYLLVHVDDILTASNNSQYEEEIMNKIGSKFQVKSLGNVSTYLGINVEKNKAGEYLISQTGFIDEIAKEAGLEMGKSSKYPLSTGYFKHEGPFKYLEDNKEYRKLIGMLLYISTNSRPDISASVSILSQNMTKPRDYDLVEVKRVIKYLVTTKHEKLKLNTKGCNESLEIFSDANWAEDSTDRKSNSGYLCKVNGGTVSWCCRKQNVVALSSCEAEYIALTETCKEVTWLRKIAEAFDMKIPEAITIKTDSQSCMAIVRNNKFSNRTKHIDTRYHYVKNLVMEGKIALEYCTTNDNAADLLTKPLGSQRMEALKRLAGFIDNTQFEIEEVE